MEALDLETYTTSLFFFVNARKIVLRSGEVDPQMTLLQFLRSRGWTGTKGSCRSGGCGACTVMVSYHDVHSGSIVHRPVNACITPLLAVADCHVITIEGIGDTVRMHPIQERLARTHASQCGFCTPGFAMSLYALLRANPNATSREIEACFDGNLCRCTGYRPILDASRTFASDFTPCCRGDGGDEGGCACANSANGTRSDANDDGDMMMIKSSSACKLLPDFKAMDGHADLIFPPLLKLRPRTALHMESAPRMDKTVHTWLRPMTLTGYLEILRRVQDIDDVAVTLGGVDFTPHRAARKFLVHPSYVPELNVSEHDAAAGMLRVGLAVAVDALVTWLGTLEGAATPGTHVAALAEAMRMLAATQVRKSCGVGCFVLTEDRFLLDLQPLLLACGARLEFSRIDTTDGMSSATYTVPLAQYLAGTNAPPPPAAGPPCGERDAPVALLFPTASTASSSETVLAFARSCKNALRRENASGIVTVAVNVALNGELTVQHAAVAVAGYSLPGLRMRCSAVEASLQGKRWTEETVRAAMAVMLAEEGFPPAQTCTHAEYMAAAAASSLFRFFAETATVLAERALIPEALQAVFEAQLDGWASAVAEWPLLATASAETTATTTAAPITTRGSQQWHVPTGGLTTSKLARATAAGAAVRSPVGDPIPHAAASAQATGEATYADDMASPAGTLFGAFVKSTVPHAKLLGVDASAALDMEGVEGFYDHRDLVRDESHLPPDYERVFAVDEVTCVGHIIGVVVAETEAQARAAALAVRVQYEELPAILDIASAIAAEHFFRYDHEIVDGDPDAAMDAAPHTVAGELSVGGQEHYYLEPHALMVVPSEDSEMTVHSCTQCVAKTQTLVAHVLGIPRAKVVVKVKRIGGGFGGKELRSTYTAAVLAVAASRLKRPVRIRFPRAEDMKITGGRHPFFGTYKAGFDATGRLLALDVRLFSNGGNTTSTTADVMNRALFHVLNAYTCPNVRVVGRLCRTHLPTNTAFRGFGAPQAMMFMETALDAIAQHLKQQRQQQRQQQQQGEEEEWTLEAVRWRNLISGERGARLHYGQRMDPACPIARMTEELCATADLGARREQVRVFNAAHKYKKRGLAVQPTVYGINFPVKFLNQSGATVMLYTDGSCLVSHSGTEMGQGLHTKMVQIAARAFGIPIEQVYVQETASDKVPNTPPTAASVGSDLNGAAVLHACEQIAARLEPLRAEMPAATFAQLVDAAHKRRINLAAVGFYKTPLGSDYDWKMDTKDNAERGSMFAYYTYGVALSEVEIDVLSGAFRVLDADILMDVGAPLNPAIDIGQIEGSFVQGYGWMTSEELHWGDTSHPWIAPGTLETKGPHLYKIPAAPSGVPANMKVRLLPNNPNTMAVHSSRGIGEPAFYLGAAVFFAIKDAIYAARADAGQHGFFRLNLPATADDIFMACTK